MWAGKRTWTIPDDRHHTMASDSDGNDGGRLVSMASIRSNEPIAALHRRMNGPSSAGHRVRNYKRQRACMGTHASAMSIMATPATRSRSS